MTCESKGAGMNPEIEQRLRGVYPTGIDDEFDETQLFDNEIYSTVQANLGAICKEYGLQAVSDDFRPVCLWKFAITKLAHMPFDEWVKVPRHEQIRWLKAHQNNFPVLFLEFSRICRYTSWHFNFWYPRGDTGYHDADFTQHGEIDCANNIPDGAMWKRFLTQGHEKLSLVTGYVPLPIEVYNQKTDYVHYRNWEALNDNSDDDAVPPLVPTTLFAALFHDGTKVG